MTIDLFEFSQTGVCLFGVFTGFEISDGTGSNFRYRDVRPCLNFFFGQGGAPDWHLVIWTWEKNPPRMMASFKTTNATSSPVYACTFSPNDNNTICVTGAPCARFVSHLSEETGWQEMGF